VAVQNQKKLQGMMRSVIGGGAATAMFISAFMGTASAQDSRVVSSERYVPTIWIDPDGCEHWIIDDGVEGYLSPRLTSDGIPDCSGLGVEDNAYAPFKDGTFIPDPL
jgi:hypothetical protein